MSQIRDDEIRNMLVDMSKTYHSKTMYRENVLSQLMAVLISESKPNALLIGPAGCGKTKIVEELAYRIAVSDPKVPEQLKRYKIYSLCLSDLVAGTCMVGSLEEKLKGLIGYLKDKKNKAILFIDEIHVMFSEHSYMKVAQMLKPALSRGQIKVIGATTTQEVKVIDSDPAFNRRFTRVLVDELTKEQTREILLQTEERLRKHYGVEVLLNKTIADRIIRIADEFCSVGSHRPDSALTLLDRTVAQEIVDGERDCVKLTEESVSRTAYKMISGNSERKPYDREAFRKDFDGIYGQDEILEELTEVISMYDMHIRPRKKPLTFLFAGPSGVGKTQVAKILANSYVGEKPIVLNMTEYQSPDTMARILGSAVGYAGYNSNIEKPFDMLETNPYQVIVLDEFEKGCQAVQRLFMSVFDEGVLRMNSGKMIDFSKAIIIATTNAGCAGRGGKLGFGVSEKKNDYSTFDLAEYFDVELLNRFSHKYTFRDISKETYAEILKHVYERERKLLKMRKGLDEKTIRELVEKSYNPVFGARTVDTVVTEYIDHQIMEKYKKRAA